MDLEKERSVLLQEMKATKGSRFNASQRLNRRDRSRTTITAFASVYVIILTIFPLAFHLASGVDSLLNLIVIVFSIIVLTMSLLQYSSGDLVRADQHHRCALEISALRRSLRLADPFDAKQLSHFSEKYDEILQRYNINHDQIDFERYKIEHPDEYPSLKEPGQKKSLQTDVKNSNQFGDRVVSSMSAVMIVVTMASFLLGVNEPYFEDLVMQIRKLFSH